MSKRIRMPIAVLLWAVLIIFGYRAKRFLEIDHCLDRGGRWNYEAGICEYHESLIEGGKHDTVNG